MSEKEERHKIRLCFKSYVLMNEITLGRKLAWSELLEIRAAAKKYVRDVGESQNMLVCTVKGRARPHFVMFD
jgi:hypothetical protein